MSSAVWFWYVLGKSGLSAARIEWMEDGSSAGFSTDLLRRDRMGLVDSIGAVVVVVLLGSKSTLTKIPIVDSALGFELIVQGSTWTLVDPDRTWDGLESDFDLGNWLTKEIDSKKAADDDFVLEAEMSKNLFVLENYLLRFLVKQKVNSNVSSLILNSDSFFWFHENFQEQITKELYFFNVLLDYTLQRWGSFILLKLKFWNKVSQE